MKKVALSCFIPKSEKTELTAIAYAKGVTITQIVREALQLYSKVQSTTNPCPVCGNKTKGK